MAYVFIGSKIGRENENSQLLKKIKEVKEVDMIFSSLLDEMYCDIILKVEASNIEELKEVLTKNIRPLEEIESTITFVVKD